MNKIEKVKKYVRDHKAEVAIMALSTTSIAALAVTSYISGKNQSAADLRIKDAEFADFNAETDDHVLLLVTHNNGQITPLKFNRKEK